MKKSFLITLLAFAFIGSAASCDKGKIANTQINDNNTMSNKIRIKVGASVFTATLSDNATAQNLGI